ncbi:penicillin-binding transpeptidase domain-containing protein [Pseudomonadales bacterium]|nr:penicillin-binding transpeptidase domain-containing protein [Pseudomonadales bacterium]MDB2449637.1 penicillin-binding transpeptidase domain-containing protein [Pseudomonadales bacterium]MDB3989660.1 penicillin-binding transpeptidase domain-containing protein [Pseudomonadales bacterium]MDC0894111.1 penicillin-binding transpeptidase domain-containing protein [Pseudomonadales bacterium]
MDKLVGKIDAIRLYLMIAFFVVVTVTLCARVIVLNVVDNDFLQDQGDARTIRIKRINAHRGMIQDRRGKPLAISSPVVSLWAKPKELLKADASIDELAQKLEVPTHEFRAKIERNKGKGFIYLRRHLPPAVADEILALKTKGVYSEREYHRYYPGGEVTAHLVGFTDIDDRGQEGIELSFDEWLKGTPGKKKVLQNRYGDIVRDIMPVSEAQPGKNLELSVDLRIQYLAYRELKSAISYFNAKAGSVVILDVQTGEILALVNQPSFNPNNRTNLDLSAVRNRAVTDIFEPGSTVKPFTVAVALESGEYTKNSVVDTHPGFIKVGAKTIPDPANYGELDLGGIIEKSSQVGITKLALSLDEYEIWNMFSSVGFGESTGIGVLGESSGFLPSHRRWKDIERATFAYGYGLQVTPVQLAASYLTIASGGIKRPLSLVGRSPMDDQRVMSRAVAADLIKMLQRVAESGTGSKASMEAYSVAGKTGTARKVGKAGYDDTRHIAFFAGMTPAESPRLVGIVMIDEPKGDQYGGGAIAAPVFSRVMAGALRLLNVTPNYLDKAA